MTRGLTTREALALEAAADGRVSGRLAEWPVLLGALRALGFNVSTEIGTTGMRALAREALRRLAVERRSAEEHRRA